MFWSSLAGGHKAHLNSYETARRQARALGFDYIENQQLLKAAPEARLERLEALVNAGLANDNGARAALRDHV